MPACGAARMRTAATTAALSPIVRRGLLQSLLRAAIGRGPARQDPDLLDSSGMSLQTAQTARLAVMLKVRQLPEYD